MVAVLDYLVFARRARLAAVYAIVATLKPALPRVFSLLSGRGDPDWVAEPLLSGQRSAPSGAIAAGGVDGTADAARSRRLTLA